MSASISEQTPDTVPLQWREGTLLNWPAPVRRRNGELLLKAPRGSDLWQVPDATAGVDSAPALLYPLHVGSAIEVDFVADLHHALDQAGLLVRADPTHWIKAGLEFGCGSIHLGAAVTQGTSNWTSAPVPGWSGHVVTVRATRRPDDIVIRARAGRDRWRTVRTAPFEASGPVSAGPYCAAPQRAGLAVRFTRVGIGPAEPTP